MGRKEASRGLAIWEYQSRGTSSATKKLGLLQADGRRAALLSSEFPARRLCFATKRSTQESTVEGEVPVRCTHEACAWLRIETHVSRHDS